MLMILGDVIFEVAPVNVDETDHAGTASFAHHPVLGEMPPLEFTGEGPENWRLRGRILPEFNERAGLDSGLEAIDAIHAMRRSGQAQWLMRGDGVPLGWVVILHASERSRRLNAIGVGRIIEFEIDLTRAKQSGADLAAYSGSTAAAINNGAGIGTTTDALPGGAPTGQGGIGHA